MSVDGGVFRDRQTTASASAASAAASAQAASSADDDEVARLARKRLAASARHSDEFPAGQQERLLEAHWIEEQTPSLEGISHLLRAQGIEEAWIAQALAVDRSVRGLFKREGRQASILRGDAPTATLYHVSSEGLAPRVILPLQPLGQGGKKIIYRVMDLAQGKMEVFAKLFGPEVLLREIPFTDEQVARGLGIQASQESSSPMGPGLIKGSHPRVLCMREVKSLQGALIGYLCPFIRGGNLRSTFSSENFYARLLFGIGLLKQGAEGVAFLHAQGLCHRDLKGDNFMVGDGQVVLIDLDGVCRAKARFASRQEVISQSTMSYLAPETLALLQALPSEEMSARAASAADHQAPLAVAGDDWRPADVWALGVALFTDVLNDLDASQFYRAAENPSELLALRDRIHESLTDRLRLAPGILQALDDLATRVFCQEPQKRCSIAEFIDGLERVQSACETTPRLQRLQKLAERDKS